MGLILALRPSGTFPFHFVRSLASASLVALAACQTPQPVSNRPVHLSIGYTSTVGTPANRVGAFALLARLSEEGLRTRTFAETETLLLAERWQQSADGLTLTLFLRRGVTFHDGSELTADLVRQSLQRSVKDPGELLEYPSLAEIAEVLAPTPDVVVVRLKRPSVFIVDALSAPIVKLDAAGQRVGTGPYFVSQVGSRDFRLRAHTDYHRGRPSIDVVELKAFGSLRAAWSALMRGEIDALYEVPLESREFVEGESSVRLYPYLRPYAYALVFNMRRPVWQSKTLRQVMNAGIDRDAIVRDAFRGYALPARGPLFDWSLTMPPRTPGGGIVQSPRVADVDHGGDLVESGGQARPRVSFSSIALSHTSAHEQVALLLHRQLYMLGIDMEIQAASLQEFDDTIETGQFDAVLIDIYGGPDLAYQHAFWHSSFQGWRGNFGYSGADDALDALLAAGSEAERNDAVANMRHAFQEDPPAVFIAWTEAARVVSRRFDVPRRSSEDVILNPWRWRPLDEPASAPSYADD